MDPWSHATNFSAFFCAITVDLYQAQCDLYTEQLILSVDRLQNRKPLSSPEVIWIRGEIN
jgi:hypothetical protein